MDERENAAAEEAELLQKAQAGDSESVEKMIVKYKFLVRRIARARFFLVSGGDAEDLVQEGTIGFLKAVREYQKEKTKGSFAAFAAVCVKSRVTDALRTYSREKHKALNTAQNLLAGENDEEYLVDSVSVSSPDPVSNYIGEEDRRRFYLKLEGLLSARQIQILKLYLEGYSYKEIAERLGVRAKTVDNVLTVAKEKIKKAETIFSEE